MKKAKKQCLGFFGLSLVTAMTVAAANMPAPKALAVSSMTDTITVRVVGVVPDVNIRGIVSGESYVDPQHSISIDYENIENIEVFLEHTYTDENGETKKTTIKIDEAALDPNTASTKAVNIDTSEYGYGKYIITVKGTARDGVYDEDSVSFEYLPVEAEISTDDTTGKQYVDLDYATDGEEGGGGGESGNEIDKIVINVYDEDGNLVEALSPITVTPPTTKVEIPFAAKNVPSGKYTIHVLAYGADGEKPLYEPYILTTTYKAADVPDAGGPEVPDAGTPDTGGLFQNLNISKEDYLISGLIVFFVLGVVAFGIVARSKKTGSKRRR